MADDDDFEWEPPSEAEMKVIQARRDRQDKVSKLMGDYLLKGYKMLGECCELCGTILLQDKQQKYYCVSCQELDSDVDKDNPALNAQAALSQVRERQLASQASVPSQVNGDPSNSHGSESIGQPRPEYCEGAAAGRRGLLAAAAPSAPVGPALTTLTSAVPVSVNLNHSSPRSALLEAEEALLAKLHWASCELKTATSLEGSIQLCNLITSCAQSLRSLRELGQSPL